MTRTLPGKHHCNPVATAPDKASYTRWQLASRRAAGPAPCPDCAARRLRAQARHTEASCHRTRHRRRQRAGSGAHRGRHTRDGIAEQQPLLFNPRGHRVEGCERIGPYDHQVIGEQAVGVQFAQNLGCEPQVLSPVAPRFLCRPGYGVPPSLCKFTEERWNPVSAGLAWQASFTRFQAKSGHAA